MHIAIDARMYGTAQRGIGRYLVKLIEHLEQVDLKNEYTVFLRRVNFDEYQPKNSHFKKAVWDAPWYGWREQVSGVRCQVSGVDLVHFPHWNVPLFFRRPFVMTVHDLELFSSNRTRENTTRGRFLYWFKHLAFRIVFRHAVLAARAIIVPSNAVREQLLDRYPQVIKKVRVIYEAPTIEGLGTSKLPNSNPYSLIPSPYVLYVGAAYPHKNLHRLLEAWKIVHDDLPEYKLVLVGREDFFWKRLKQQWSAPTPPNPRGLRSLDPSATPSGRGGKTISPPLGGGVRGGLVFYSSASDEELTVLYQRAALLVQPSLEEGFSLSPLEALSFGCPVAVSDIPVHREILGNAARYFDPLSINAAVETVKKALTIPYQCPLPRDYSWRSHAQETRLIYEMVKKV